MYTLIGVGWLVGWLVGLLVGWLVGWLSLFYFSRFSSDHKVVIGELHLDTLYKLYRTPNHYTPPVALGKLCDINVRKEYPNALKNNNDICLDASNSESLSVIRQRVADNVRETAESVLGRRVQTKRGSVDPSPEIQQLSAKQRSLRTQVQSGSLSEDKMLHLRQERNRLSHAMRWLCMDDANHRLDTAAEVVERAPGGVQMFQAAAVFRRGARRSIIVESANGLVLDRDADKASRVRDHFSSLL